MPETSTEETGLPGPAAEGEPNPVVGRYDSGQFVKVTHLRPVVDAPRPHGDRRRASLESRSAEFSAEELVIRVPEKQPTTPSPRIRLLRLLAPRMWRR
jgi:hypothetical protein